MKHYQQKGINFMRNCCSFKGYKLRLKIKQIALLELVSIFSCNLKYQMGIVKRNKYQLRRRDSGFDCCAYLLFKVELQ